MMPATDWEALRPTIVTAVGETLLMVGATIIMGGLLGLAAFDVATGDFTGQMSRPRNLSMGPRRPIVDKPASCSSWTSKPLRSRCLVSVSQPSGA